MVKVGDRVYPHQIETAPPHKDNFPSPAMWMKDNKETCVVNMNDTLVLVYDPKNKRGSRPHARKARSRRARAIVKSTRRLRRVWAKCLTMAESRTDDFFTRFLASRHHKFVAGLLIGMAIQCECDHDIEPIKHNSGGNRRKFNLIGQLAEEAAKSLDQ